MHGFLLEDGTVPHASCPSALSCHSNDVQFTSLADSPYSGCDAALYTMFLYSNGELADMMFTYEKANAWQVVRLCQESYPADNHSIQSSQQRFAVSLRQGRSGNRK